MSTIKNEIVNIFTLLFRGGKPVPYNTIRDRPYIFYLQRYYEKGRQGCRPLQQLSAKPLCLEKINLFDMKKHYIHGKNDTMSFLGMSRLDADIHSDHKNIMFLN